MQLIVTCEHFSPRIPPEWEGRFKGAEKALNSHRGWDIGAPELLSAFQPPALEIYCGEWSRLLIDLNRSENHPACFSEFARIFSKAEKDDLIARIHRPFRAEVHESISKIIRSGETVLHLSIHTFTPELNGIIRSAEFALLYDPSRPVEKNLVETWGRHLGRHGRFRRNYPYRGVADGHTTALRRKFPTDRYIGIELEVNQSIAGKESTVAALQSSFETVWSARNLI